jgi:hypothetical protein
MPRGKGLRPFSDKRRADSDEREAVRLFCIERDGGCAARDLLPGDCWGRLDPHEPHPHADLLDPEQVLTLCRNHHTMQNESAHHSPRRYELGLLCHNGDPLWSWERDWKGTN